MQLTFTKVHGLGNDFVLIDARALSGTDFRQLVPSLCHRQTGIGADGLLLVENSVCADIRMRIINNDGSEAEMCGNGIRAFSKYVYEKGILSKTAFSIETLAGIIRPQVIVEGGVVSGVRVDMGEPFLERRDIPVTGEGRCIDQPLAVAGESFRITTVLVGVPHTIVFVEDPTTANLPLYGNAIEHADMFPKGTNVNFVRVHDRSHITMRTWERGCGPTLCCGTGASSAVVACVLNGKTDRSVEVQVALGTLHIHWAEDNHVYMTGPASIVYEGKIDI